MKNNNNLGIILPPKYGNTNDNKKTVPTRNNLGIILPNKRNNNDGKIHSSNEPDKTYYFSLVDTYSTKKYKEYHRKKNSSNTNYGDRYLLPTNYPSVSVMQSSFTMGQNLGAIPF